MTPGGAARRDVLTVAAFETLFGGLALLAVVGAQRMEGRGDQPTHGRSAAVPDRHRLNRRVLRLRVRAQTLPVTTVSLYAYVNPVIAVILGALLLREPFTVRMALASALIFAGVGLVRSSACRSKVGDVGASVFHAATRLRAPRDRRIMA